MYMLRSIVYLCLCSMFSVLANAQNYSIGQLSTIINDPARSNRSIGVEVFYPANSAGSNVPVANGATYPVIVIGHGFSMGYDAYRNFWEELVPLGFIVALPKTEVGPIPFPSHGDLGKDMAYTLKWLQGQDTVSSSIFFGKVAATSAFMGHSMGGGCSFIAAEQMPTVTTIANFAAAETNPSAITAASNVNVPALVFAASKDNVAPPVDNQVDMYNALASTNKWLVNLTDPSHCGFANSNTLCEFGELTVCPGCSFIDRQDQHQLQFSILVPWLQFFLKGECDKWAIFDGLMQQPVGFTVVEDHNITLPQASISIQGASMICTIDTTYLVGTGGGAYWWSNGDTMATTFITSPGTYSLVVTDQLGCADTAQVNITSSNVIKPVINTPSNVPCAGDTVLLSVGQLYSSYQWSTGDTTSVIDSITSSALFSVTVTNANGCTATSDTLDLRFREPNLQTAILLRSDSLIAEGGTVISWYYNGSKLGNYSGDFLYPITAGTYMVEFADSFGCRVFSEEFEYVPDTVNSVWSLETSQLIVYPNPVDAKLIVETDDEFAAVQLLDLYGNEVHVPILIRNGQHVLDCSDLANGLYLVRVESMGKMYLRKIVK